LVRWSSLSSFPLVELVETRLVAAVALLAAASHRPIADVPDWLDRTAPGEL